MAEAQAQQENYKVVMGELEKMQKQIASLLPKHIPVERFVRIVRTAIANDPRMAEPGARRSLFNAALNCAKDGLLPDGREAVFNVYNTNVAPKGTPAIYEPRVVYIPMIAGVCKKVRQSGEIKMLDAQVVHEKDEYDSWTDERGPHFRYRKTRGERGKPIITFAYATLADDTPFFEELTEQDIQAIKNVSKAKDSGPWSGPFEDEMRRKSALKRLAKYRLPQSAELDEVMSRDNELYEFDDNEPARPALTALEDKQPNGEKPPPTGKRQANGEKKPPPPTGDKLDPVKLHADTMQMIKEATVETFSEVNKAMMKAYSALAGRDDLRQGLLKAINERRVELDIKP